MAIKQFIFLTISNVLIVRVLGNWISTKSPESRLMMAFLLVLTGIVLAMMVVVYISIAATALLTLGVDGQLAIAAPHLLGLLLLMPKCRSAVAKASQWLLNSHPAILLGLWGPALVAVAFLVTFVLGVLVPEF